MTPHALLRYDPHVNIRALVGLIYEIENPPPDPQQFREVVDEDEDGYCLGDVEDWAYEEAAEAWNANFETYLENVDEWLSNADDPVSLEMTTLKAVRRASSAVSDASRRRDELIALAVHGVGLPIGRTAAYAGMHHRTAEKRASDPDALRSVLRYKENEVAELRERIAQTAKDQGVS